MEETLDESQVEEKFPVTLPEEEGREAASGTQPPRDQGKEEELEDEDEGLGADEDSGEPPSPRSYVETNGTLTEAGSQQDEGEEEEDEDVESHSLGPPEPCVNVASGTQPALGTTNAPPQAEQSMVQPPTSLKSQSSKSQEKREQRRRRGLEHNQRESERAASSTPAVGKDESLPKSPRTKSKGQEATRLKESKELDQYPFVHWKVKEDKGGKKEAQQAVASPVRPSTLALRPSDGGPERNGHEEPSGVSHLQRRPGALKDKPEKWKGGRRSEGVSVDTTSRPQLDSVEHKRQIHTQYVRMMNKLYLVFYGVMQ